MNSEQIWHHFYTKRDKHPQAILLLGARHTNIASLVEKMAATLLCTEAISPCSQCLSCKMAANQQHPDIYCLYPEKTDSFIKVDQVRDLQPLVHTKGQLNGKKIILINPADQMNVAAANALLKLLEEPPEHLYFFLVAEQLSTVLPTIVSRCQQWRMVSDLTDIFACFPYYENKQDERATLVSQLPSFLEDLISLQKRQNTASGIALKWSSYPLSALLWLLYLVTAEILVINNTGEKTQNNALYYEKLFYLSQHLAAWQLFDLLDALQNLIRMNNKAITLNQTSALESYLLLFTS